MSEFPEKLKTRLSKLDQRINEQDEKVTELLTFAAYMERYIKVDLFSALMSMTVWRDALNKVLANQDPAFVAALEAASKEIAEEYTKHIKAQRAEEAAEKLAVQKANIGASLGG